MFINYCFRILHNPIKAWSLVIYVSTHEISNNYVTLIIVLALINMY